MIVKMGSQCINIESQTLVSFSKALVSLCLSETLMEAKEDNFYVFVLRKTGTSARSFTAETTYNTSHIYACLANNTSDLCMVLTVQC